MLRGNKFHPAFPALLLLLCSLLTVLPLLGGCGSGGGAALLELTIQPGDFTARVGDQVALFAIGAYSNGVQRDVTREVTWASSDPAVGNISATQILTAHAVGRTEITASQGAITSDVLTVDVVAVPDLPTADYFPLGLGYVWQYTGSEVSPTGVRPQGDPITLTQSVTQQVVIDGTTWYEVLVKGTDPTEPPGHLYMRHDPEGLVRNYNDGTAPVVLLDAALSPGTTWKDPEETRRTFVIESTFEEVSVPAGTFAGCVKVVETDTRHSPPARTVVWFKEGVGLVKEEVYDGDQLALQQKLVAYQLGPP